MMDDTFSSRRGGAKKRGFKGEGSLKKKKKKLNDREEDG